MLPDSEFETHRLHRSRVQQQILGWPVIALPRRRRDRRCPRVGGGDAMPVQDGLRVLSLCAVDFSAELIEILALQLRGNRLACAPKANGQR